MGVSGERRHSSQANDDRRCADTFFRGAFCDSSECLFRERITTTDDTDLSDELLDACFLRHLSVVDSLLALCDIMSHEICEYQSFI